MIPKKIRDKILAQIPFEMEYARQAKEPRLPIWAINEDLYYGRKKPTDASRSNVMLPKMQGFVETMLSKIDDAPTIRYEYTNLADYQASQLLTSMAEYVGTPEQDDWSMKDLLGKKQAIIYGRAIYEYHADSKPSYESHLSLVDVYDFLIDPRAGGYDMERAMYLGRGNIIKTPDQLKQGVKDGKYTSSEVKKLLTDSMDEESAVGDADETISVEEQNKENRYAALGGRAQNAPKTSSFKFWEWYTTCYGKRYYILYNETKQVAIKIEELKTLFDSELWPFYSWAISPSWTDFWTPGASDSVAEIYMAQSVLINQWLDNAEARNRPMKGYDVEAVRDPALLKYGRDRVIAFKKGTDPNRAVRIFETPTLEGVDRIFNLLEGVQERETGMTADTKGMSTEDKVGIYEGNLANVSDRLRLLNESYAHAYHRLGLLFMHGVKEHLRNKVAISVLGENGVRWQEVQRKHLLPSKGRSFNIRIISSNDEQTKEIAEKKLQLDFLTARVASQTINQKVSDELAARIVGFDEADIKRLLNPQDDGNIEMMAEASRDIQRIVGGEDIEPNEKAGLAYLQRFVDYVRDEGEHIDEAAEQRLFAYMALLKPIIMRNTVNSAMSVVAKQGRLGEMLGREDLGGQPPMEDINNPANGTPENPTQPIV